VIHWWSLGPSTYSLHLDTKDETRFASWQPAVSFWNTMPSETKEISSASSSSTSRLFQKRNRNDTTEQQPTSLPLHEVVICLSGFTHEVKNELHQLIESLGGKYVTCARTHVSDMIGRSPCSPFTSFAWNMLSSLLLLY
jgi:hypothetical protein